MTLTKYYKENKHSVIILDSGKNFCKIYDNFSTKNYNAKEIGDKCSEMCYSFMVVWK